MSKVHVNNAKHGGAVDVHQHPALKQITDFKVGAGFTTVKTLAVGEGDYTHEGVGHVVIKPQLYPQVACHVIFHDDKSQISNKTPFGEIHLIVDQTYNSFSIENQHEGDLHIKFTPPLKESLKESDTGYLGSFNGAETVKKGNVQQYRGEGHYVLRSTLDSDPANICAIDFIKDKIYMTNGTPVGEIGIALQKA
ncbi:hypothetical protein K435DRAFT_967757 [Dendrothele bispora CBS 962.96]|uniref:Uncharacterized protein n=1 Tax=Dendrothele bispora (strain CBS 962.96) TaxID=1314807 RepID=A0A4S8LS26_DENBC|nr:hypothetical protein K435DRAFT_967757 [Dendrothele bispora CBS 962.96]